MSRPYDQVVDRFPGTSEQVLFADAYLTEELPEVVLPPVAPSGVVTKASGRLGSVYLMMLAKTVVEEDDALALVRPWSGDSYVQWTDGDRACAAVDVLMDDEASAAAVADVLQTWAAAETESTVKVDGASISVVSCSP